MTRTPVVTVLDYRERCEEGLHEPGKIRLSGPDVKMKMVSHQAVGEYLHGKDLGKFAKLVYEQFTVPSPFKYLLPPVATVYDMIECSRIFHSQRPRHASVHPFLAFPNNIAF